MLLVKISHPCSWYHHYCWQQPSSLAMPIVLVTEAETEGSVSEEDMVAAASEEEKAAAVSEEVLVTEEVMVVLAPEVTEAVTSVQQIPDTT